MEAYAYAATMFVAVFFLVVNFCTPWVLRGKKA